METSELRSLPWGKRDKFCLGKDGRTPGQMAKIQASAVSQDAQVAAAAPGEPCWPLAE
jgi:hypothetical protein